MKTLAIASIDSLESAVAEVVRMRIELTGLKAKQDAQVAAVYDRHQAGIAAAQEQIAALENMVLEYCAANARELFPEKKSRETNLAVFGFEFTPPRVEPATRKIKWRDVLARLQRLAWGKKYLRYGEPTINKEALLADREQLTPEMCAEAGIEFERDELFYIRPKPETADQSEAP